MSRKYLRIQPPPKEKDSLPNFRVVYVIDANASSAKKAAKLTHQIMTDPDSMLPVLQVMNCKGKVVTIDLSKKK
ncbi:MAG: hypothetical protein A2Y10_04010 [Planctomycetes bacterium GWF2_41_51]|nr:MAG: hypothetical protein A2Y10_04010 [Planctomycetes bacterium GWF2_41_51]HBG26189.1 hypothetical protein [Phycisphaerales bacterium]